MIWALACRCANAEPLIRRTLNEAHHPSPLKVPIAKGREECLNFLSQFPENETIKEIESFIKQRSSWSVVLGEKNGKYLWGNCSDHTPQGKIDVEVIVENML